jgi:hypothetical protein
VSVDLIPGEFAIDQVWTAIQALLSQELGSRVNVDAIGTQDFDEEGEVTITPPAARVLFVGEVAKGFETQSSAYNAEQAFAVLCADEDLGVDPQAQRIKSVQLAGRVKHILTGARIQLTDGEQSEPVIYVKTDPLPTSGTGMAYIAQFLVGGIAQFAAPNAFPESE